MFTVWTLNECLNTGWVFVYELSGCGFESSSSLLNFQYLLCIFLVPAKRYAICVFTGNNFLRVVSFLCCRWNVYRSPLTPRKLICPKKVLATRLVTSRKPHYLNFTHAIFIITSLRSYVLCFSSVYVRKREIAQPIDIG